LSRYSVISCSISIISCSCVFGISIYLCSFVIIGRKEQFIYSISCSTGIIKLNEVIKKLLFIRLMVSPVLLSTIWDFMHLSFIFRSKNIWGGYTWRLLGVEVVYIILRFTDLLYFNLKLEWIKFILYKNLCIFTIFANYKKIIFLIFIFIYKLIQIELANFKPPTFTSYMNQLDLRAPEPFKDIGWSSITAKSFPSSVR